MNDPRPAACRTIDEAIKDLLDGLAEVRRLRERADASEAAWREHQLDMRRRSRCAGPAGVS